MIKFFSKKPVKWLNISAIILVSLAFIFSGCKGDDDTTTAPQIDEDGDTLSQSTTGIKLPKSVQTIPADSTASRLNRLNSAKGGE